MFPRTMLAGVGRSIARLRRIHREIQTVRFLNALPADIRKDIGWPDRFNMPDR